MPVIMYTQDEYTLALAASNTKAMALAQALCIATSYPCIRAADDEPDGPGEYCDDCPAQDHCPEPFKQWSQ